MALATSEIDTSYARGLAHLLQLMQTQLLKCFQLTPLEDREFKHTFQRIYFSMQKLEIHRTAYPKFSVYCTELAQFLNIRPFLGKIRAKVRFAPPELAIIPERIRKVSPHSVTPVPRSESVWGKHAKKAFTPLERRWSSSNKLKSGRASNIYYKRALWKLATELVSKSTET